MYGLMRSRTCAPNPEAALRRRLHYCGACKTMGRLYGQRSRMLLNNDAVFLAELLTALSAGALPETWVRAYRSYNCMALPDSETEMPLSLQFAATATLLMTEFKVADQIDDASHPGWRLIGRIYSPGFCAASARMDAWGVPVRGLWDWYRVQQKREASVRAGGLNPSSVLTYLAEPTAVVTGEVFRHGARLVGAADAVQETMYALGHAFGRLVYLLDAFEDDVQDARKGDFNAFQAAFGVWGVPLQAAQRAEAVEELCAAAGQVRSALQHLPLPSDQLALFTGRLNANLTHRVGVPMEKALSADAAACTAQRRNRQRGWKARWKAARDLAHSLAQQQRSQAPGLSSTLCAPFIFGFAFLVALVFPRQALAATSFRECMDVAFSLMVWGAALGALLSAPKRLVPTHALAFGGGRRGDIVESGQTTSTQVTRVRRRRQWGCCCCDNWSCCAEGTDCACCCCEGIECGECCCSSCDCSACASGCDCCSSCG